jgi:hypothetical protein
MENPLSKSARISETTKEIAITVIVYFTASRLVGHVIFLISEPTSPKKLPIEFDDFINVE